VALRDGLTGRERGLRRLLVMYKQTFFKSECDYFFGCFVCVTEESHQYFLVVFQKDKGVGLSQ
jgi:hypothetical protein